MATIMFTLHHGHLEDGDEPPMAMIDIDGPEEVARYMIYLFEKLTFRQMLEYLSVGGQRISVRFGTQSELEKACPQVVGRCLEL